jgi:hypothetical protein
MKKHLVVGACLAAVNCVDTAEAAPRAMKSASDSPTNFYLRLAEAVTDVDAHLLLYFNDGEWETPSKAVGGPVRWTIDPGTIADVTAKYSNRSLQQAKIVFNKPIHIYLPISKGASLKLSTLKYDANGTLIDDDAKPNVSPSQTILLKEGQYVGANRLRRILDLSSRPELLLKGTLYTNIEAVRALNKQSGRYETTRQPIVYQVSFKKTKDLPGLLVSVGRDTDPNGITDVTLPFAAPGFGESYLSVSTGTVNFDDLVYYVDQHFVSGTLTSLKIQLLGGRLASGDLYLRLADGSKFEAERIVFSHDGSTGKNTVESERATFDVAVGAQSRVQLAKAGRDSSDAESFLTLDDGSHVQLKDVEIRQSDGVVSSVSWSNRSHQHFVVADGRINLGQGSYINVGRSDFDMNLSGTWEVGQVPRVSATEVNFTMEAHGGEARINASSVLRLGHGKLSGDHLAIDSTQRPILRGTLKEMSLEILAQTRIAFPGSLFLETRDVGSFRLDPAGTGLQIGLSSPYPVGKYLLDVKFSVLDNSASKNFELQDGAATLPVETLADGTIQNPQLPNPMQWKINGNLVVQPPSGTPLIIASSIVGDFKMPRGAKPEFDGKFSGAAQPGFTLHITTPSSGMRGQPPPQDDMHLYSISADLRATQSFVIPTTTFRIGSNARAEVKVALDLPFELAVAPGKGEHTTSDDPGSADGSNGPKEVHGWQEVLQTTHVCTLHMYVAPKTQSGGLKGAIELTSGALQVDIDELHFDHGFVDHDDYWRDGCDPTLLGSVLGALLGGLPGLVGGYILGHKVNNSIDDAIRERIGAFAHGFKGSWHFAFR